MLIENMLQSGTFLSQLTLQAWYYYTQLDQCIDASIEVREVTCLYTVPVYKWLVHRSKVYGQSFLFLQRRGNVLSFNVPYFLLVVLERKGNGYVIKDAICMKF